MTSSSSPLFTWRRAMLDSNLAATTKHVLLTLSCRMNPSGASCFPSIETLSKETSLSRTSVMTHLQRAAELNWLAIAKRGLEGKQWKRNDYRLSFPTHDNKAVIRSEPNWKGSQRDGHKVVKEVDTSTSKSTSVNLVQRTLKGTRISPNWTLDEDYIKHALLLRPIDLDELKGIADEFKDYWIAVPGSKGVKLDWLATWRNWIRRAKTTATITVKNEYVSR